MQETWKEIPEYNGDYQVSDMGSVKSIERTVTRGNGREYFVRERILRAATDGNGYRRCALMKNKKLVTHKVHRLVAQAFCDGEIEGMTVDHLNGIKSDNRAENLEIVTASENVRRSFATGLQPKIPKGEDNHGAKLTQKQADMIRECYHSRHNEVSGYNKKPFTYRWLSKAFDIDRKTIGQIVRGEKYCQS